MLDAYRRYMRGRRYSPETVWARFAVARDWLGRHPELDADHRDVETWVADRDVGPGASRNLVTNLRAFYRWAMREGHASIDATALVDRPRVPARLPRPAPDMHIAHVLAGAEVGTAAIVALMACAGLRCVEVSRLDWADVDLGAGTVVVMGKGSRERLITLSADVVRCLAALDGVDGPVFPGPTGRRRSAARVSQIVNAAFRHLGYATTAHQLRHRCATTALRLPDADLLAVRDLLGHASVATTQIYTAVIPERTAATSAALTLPTV